MTAAPEVKLLAETPHAAAPDGVFTGYASLFGIADLGRDVVLPGAFRDSLARRGAAGVRMLWQHDPAEPVGRWLSLVEDHRGLKVRGRLNLALGRAREIAAMLAEGSIDGLSIGFRVEKARPAGGLRRLERVDLWEISIVTFPMMPGARVEAPRLPPATAAALPLALAIRRAARRLGADRRPSPSPARHAGHLETTR